MLMVNTNVALFNLSFPFSILQFTYKNNSECEGNVFLRETYIVKRKLLVLARRPYVQKQNFGTQIITFNERITMRK